MQMKRVLVIIAVAALVSSVAVAENRSSDQTVRGGMSMDRTNGTLGSFTASIVQTGPLQVTYGATVTTAGGDGAAFPWTTTGGAVVGLNDQVRVAAQIYDSPWSLHTFEYFEGITHINSPTALGSFTSSFSIAVPRAANYQVWAAAIAGIGWYNTDYAWGSITQGLSTVGTHRYYSHFAGPIGTEYVDATQPPTPTPPPGGYGGEPIPTLNWMGILAMIAIMGGIAVLVMTRK